MTKSTCRDDLKWPPSNRNGGRDQIGIGGRHRRNPRELALEAAIARLDRFDLLILDDLAYVGKDLDVVSLPDNQIAI